MSIDTAISSFFMSVQSPLSLQIFNLISLSLYALIGIALIYLMYKKDKENFIRFGLFAVIIYLLAELLKIIVGRQRPDLSGNDSFPSRHAVVGFFTAYFLPVDKKYKILLYVWAILIGISRLALNVHWFSDVLAGSLIGLAFAFLIEKIKIPLKFKRK